MRWAVCEIVHTRFVASLLFEIKSANSSHCPMMMLTQSVSSCESNTHRFQDAPNVTSS